MNEIVWTWDSIIAELGGTGAVAEAFGEASSTVSSWRSRPRGIPAERWSSVVRLAAEKGKSEITLDVLADLAARREPVEARA